MINCNHLYLRLEIENKKPYFICRDCGEKMKYEDPLMTPYTEEFDPIPFETIIYPLREKIMVCLHERFEASSIEAQGNTVSFNRESVHSALIRSVFASVGYFELSYKDIRFACIPYDSKEIRVSMSLPKCEYRRIRVH